MSTLAENVQKVVDAHAGLKTALESKGVEVPEGTKLSEMPALVSGMFLSEIASFSKMRLPKDITMDEHLIVNLATVKDAEDYGSLFGSSAKGSANQDIETVTFPPGFGQNATTMMYMFAGCSNLRSVTFPPGFGKNVERLSYLFCPAGSTAFENAVLTDLNFPDGFGVKSTTFTRMFRGLTALKSVNLPQGFGSAAVHSSSSDTAFSRMFEYCGSLEDINGELCANESLDLSYSPLLTHQSLVNVLNSIRTVSHAPTLTLGATNLAKLTDEEKAIATGKGWTLA